MSETNPEELLSNIVTEVRRIAAEYPDFVYTETKMPVGSIWVTRCFYSPNESNPNGCIIGFAMRNLGMSVDEFDTNHDSISAETVIPLRLGLSDSAEFEALEWLNTVQRRQDHGKSWSEAVVSADGAEGS